MDDEMTFTIYQMLYIMQTRLANRFGITSEEALDFLLDAIKEAYNSAMVKINNWRLSND